MIEINIKRYENGEKTSVANKDVEAKDLYNFMYYEMKDFLKKSNAISYKETHYNLHCGKRDLLISFEYSDPQSGNWYINSIGAKKWLFIFNGIQYSYYKRLKGLKNAIAMFINFVKQDANIKRT